MPGLWRLQQKNCNYSERSKFLGDNSLFHPLRTWKQEKATTVLPYHHIPINSTAAGGFLNAEDAYVHVGASPALLWVKKKKGKKKKMTGFPAE